MAGIKKYLIDNSSLEEVTRKRSLANYLSDLWKYRFFISYDAQSRIQSGLSTNRLGSAWLVLTPLFNGAVYYFIFGVLLNTSRNIENFIGFLVVGVFVFQLSATAITNCSKSVSGNITIISAFSFPRATLPISSLLRDIVASLPTVIVMLVIVAVLPIIDSSLAENSRITFSWFLIFPIFALQIILSLGIGLIFARVNALFSDFSNFLPFIMRILFYASGVFFSLDRLSGYGVVYEILKNNPFAIILEGVRGALLYDEVLPLSSWIALITASLVLFVVGCFFFWRAETRYGRK